MRSKTYRLGGLATAVGLLVWFAAGEIALAQQVRFRDLVLRKDMAGLAKAIGVDKVTSIVAIEHRVLLFRDGDWQTVDPKVETFRVGDLIRLEVKSHETSYIYIYYLHEGEGGSRGFLLPEVGGRPPLVKGGEAVVLPEGNGCIEFTPPPGVEKVFVIAAKQPVSDLDLLAATITTDPKQHTPDQVTMQEKLHGTSDARLESFGAAVDRLGGRSYVLRGAAGGKKHKEMRERIRDQGADWVVIEEPPGKKGEGTAGILLGTKDEDASQDKLKVTIPLRSIEASSESG